MKNLIIKEYKDFELIVKNLKKDNVVKIDLKELDNKMKIRIIDLVVGYIHDIGKMKKESATSFVVSLGK